MKYAVSKVVAKDGKFAEETVGFKQGSENPCSIINTIKNAAGVLSRQLPAGDKLMITEALRNSETEGPQLVELNGHNFKVFSVGVLASAGSKMHKAEKKEVIEISKPEVPTPVIQQELPVVHMPEGSVCFECKKVISGKHYRIEDKGWLCDACRTRLIKELETVVEDIGEENEKDKFIMENMDVVKARFEKHLDLAYANHFHKDRVLFGFEIFDDRGICSICGKAVDPRDEEGKKKFSAIYKGKKASLHAGCLIDRVKLDPTFVTMLEYEYFGFKLPETLKEQLLGLWASFEIKVHDKIQHTMKTAARKKSVTEISATDVNMEDENRELTPEEVAAMMAAMMKK